MRMCAALSQCSPSTGIMYFDSCAYVLVVLFAISTPYTECKAILHTDDCCTSLGSNDKIYNHIITPKMHGAIGDGEHNDTAAVIAAVEACNAAGGCTLLFADGGSRADGKEQVLLSKVRTSLT
eukprot:m.474645 g.474645  ORF g.474645 m.474645 type:complete len:123 (-) comp21678_c0_seq3:17-385(-)